MRLPPRFRAKFSSVAEFLGDELLFCCALHNFFLLCSAQGALLHKVHGTHPELSTLNPAAGEGMATRERMGRIRTPSLRRATDAPRVRECVFIRDLQGSVASCRARHPRALECVRTCACVRVCVYNVQLQVEKLLQ